MADITSRLEAAGVSEFRGFSLNVSNYQWSPNLQQYGTWISECAALHPDAARPDGAGDVADEARVRDAVRHPEQLPPRARW